MTEKLPDRMRSGETTDPEQSTKLNVDHARCLSWRVESANFSLAIKYGNAKT